jgi:hypothetical protein
MGSETKSTGRASAAVWGAFLILMGGLMLLEFVVELSVWVWAGFLAIMGFAFYGVYAIDRSRKTLLIPSYVMFVIAGMISLIELDVLIDEAVAVYVLLAIAAPFVYGYLRNRAAYGLLIPAYILIVVAGIVGLSALDILTDNTIASYVLFSSALPFLLAYARNSKLWWALIPGGILGIVGFALLLTDDLARYVGPAAMILFGAWILVRAFFRRETEEIESTEPEHSEA